jgi:large subunit ribosomal protein L23
MKIEPIITEKSLMQASKGVFTFRVTSSLTKFEIKHLVEKTFGVHVTDVRTMNQKPETKRGFSRRVKTIPGYKKALVELKDKETIDLFEIKK